MARRAQEARRTLEALLQRDASDQDARQQLGQVYLAEGRYDEVYDQLLPAVEKLAERRQTDRAAQILQQIVQKNLCTKTSCTNPSVISKASSTQNAPFGCP